MKKITTIFKTISFIAVVLVMAQACIPTAVTPEPINLTGKIKSIQKFSYFDGFPATFSMEIQFKYDSNGKPAGIDIVQGGTILGKYVINEGTDKITVASLPGYNYSQYGITKSVYYIHPNTMMLDSIHQTTDDTILNYRVVFERNNLNEILEINEYNAVTSNLSHIILNDFVYNNGNIISYRYTDAYNNVFNLSYEYDLTKIQKPFTNAYLTNFLNFGFLEGYAGEGSEGNIAEFLGLSYGKMSSNLIISYPEANPDFGYQTYTNLQVKTKLIRTASIFNPNLYSNSYTLNSYY